MADTTDLKSVGLKAREGSNPSPSTRDAVEGPLRLMESKASLRGVRAGLHQKRKKGGKKNG